MGKLEIERFLTALAVERNVAASTQNQALTAILFLYKEVLDVDPGWMDDVVRAKRPQRLPVVLTRGEVQALLAELDGISWLMAMILYGAGLQLMECLRLRVKDVDFGRGEILVREGKGNKDRVTMLPAAVKEPLVAHLGHVRRLHERDLRRGSRTPNKRLKRTAWKTRPLSRRALRSGGGDMRRLLLGAARVS